MKLVSATGSKPTIADVARLAGVSKATVSRRLNGARVGHAGAIDDAIASLGYRPSAAARSLRSGSTAVIGLLVPDLANPFFGSALRGIESVAREHGFNLLVGNSDEDPAKETGVLNELIGHGLDGLVFTPTVERPGEVDILTRLPFPVVLFDRLLSRPLFDSVLIDNAGGSRQAVRHLIALGHRRIGLITGPLYKTPDIDRRRGYMEALAEAGIPVDEDLLEIADCMEEGGYQSALRLIGRSNRPTALYVASNMMALGALKALRELGVRIPEELSFAGFDDLEAAELMSPAPTVVDRPMSEQGAVAMRLLLDRIRDPRRPPRHIVMDTHLVVRGSTAAVTITAAAPLLAPREGTLLQIERVRVSPRSTRSRGGVANASEGEGSR